MSVFGFLKDYVQGIVGVAGAISVCCIAAVAFPIWASVTNVWYKSFGEWANAVSPLAVWRFVESNGTERSFLVCPKTSKVYEIIHGHVEFRTSVEIDPRTFATSYWPTNIIKGVVVSDMIGMIRVHFKQGETSFGYPYDMELTDDFGSRDIFKAPFDGDYICYSTSNRHFDACATFAADGKTIRWHDPETFELIKSFPFPDPDKELSYYRRQGTNTTLCLVGGIKREGPSFYSYLEHGIVEANRLAGNFKIKRENWRTSLLGGYIKWTEEFPKTSIRDPRKFYVVLSDGRKAFAMIQEDHKHLVSPISHALLPVSKSDIARFEPITDNAYDEGKCFTKGEVDELFAEFSKEERSDLPDSRGLILIIWILSGLAGSFAERIYSLITGKTCAFLQRHRFARFWFVVLVIAGTIIWCACG